jgi:TRAP-type C4-dicarboxylate transport system substrate-binding protein
MKGLKIRTMNNPMHMQIVKLLGASPTPISWSELYSALQTGVVDGQENSLPIFRIPKLGSCPQIVDISFDFC